MDKKLDTLYELCDTVYHDLESANEKIKMAGGELSQGDVDYLQKLSSCMKNIKMTIGMIESEEEGYSGDYYYDGESMEGRGGRSNARGGGQSRNSYARGGGGGRSNRGSYRGSYARGGSRGYSRDDAREDFMEEIEELMEKAPDEHTRKKFERFLSEMK